MVYDILHDMSERKESGLCWLIHVDTDKHGNELKIVLILNSDVHEYTNTTRFPFSQTCRVIYHTPST